MDKFYKILHFYADNLDEARHFSRDKYFFLRNRHLWFDFAHQPWRSGYYRFRYRYIPTLRFAGTPVVVPVRTATPPFVSLARSLSSNSLNIFQRNIRIYACANIPKNDKQEKYQNNSVNDRANFVPLFYAPNQCNNHKHECKQKENYKANKCAHLADVY